MSNPAGLPNTGAPSTGSGASGSPAILGAGSRRTPNARLGVVVVHDLVSAIVTGEVQPGDLLPTESVLTEHFGVSRTVIRESVKRLEEKGLVRVTQGRGTEITDPSEWNILDRVVLGAFVEHDATLGILDEIAVIRAQLESVMAAGCAERRSDADLDALRAAMAEMHRTVDDTEGFAQTDIDFHVLVMDISGNRLAEGIARTLVARARDNSRFYGAPGPEAPTETLAEHEAILDAIAAGDAEAAARLMSDHITTAWERRRIPREA